MYEKQIDSHLSDLNLSIDNLEIEKFLYNPLTLKIISEFRFMYGIYPCLTETLDRYHYMKQTGCVYLFIIYFNYLHSILIFIIYIKDHTLI